MAQPNTDRLVRIAGMLANVGHEVEFNQDSAGLTIKVEIPGGYFLFGQDINSPKGPWDWNWEYATDESSGVDGGGPLSGIATDSEVAAWAHAVINQREV